MGRALAKPIAVPRGRMMGFATLYPSYGLQRLACRKPIRPRRFLVVQLLLYLFDQFGRDNVSRPRKLGDAISQLQFWRRLLARSRSLCGVLLTLVVHGIKLAD
jgi:hypothetical protein